jgi:phosphosulfolactate synthase
VTLNIDLPARPQKPRSIGRTHLLDKGLGTSAIRDLLDVASDSIDLVKLGWGTSLVTQGLEEKIACYTERGIDVCVGGTLLELVYLKGKVDAFVDWIGVLGLKHVEVSDGVVRIPAEDKSELISRLAKDFVVYSEVGSKDQNVVVTPAKWVAEIKRDFDAGASLVILEGRESGTAGMYRDSGEIRMGLIDEILDADIAQDTLLFEAPHKENQVWLMRHLGPHVNLGNVAPEDSIAVETLRLGLRSDTLLDLHR